MIRSMTGYGRSGRVMFDRKISIEIKSVNHRYNDLSVKMPRILNPFEDAIRKMMAQTITRGKVDVYINLESFSSDDVIISLNKPLADAYAEKLKEIKQLYSTYDDVSLSLISRFPDVVSVGKNDDSEKSSSEISETLFCALSDAIEQFNEMREREGAALKTDLLMKIDMLSELAAKVLARSPEIVAEYRKKLLVRMSDVLADTNIDETRILTEAAIFADKSCIDEELTRLSSHLSQFKQILQSEGAIGKKLDFLVQEINREINTTGSKSNDVEITGYVIEMKSESEKIREQVQNIE